ncbi:Intron-binding protein aquarius [Toxocara canis]|uniref:Intron-binding protein aquarius n=1 Tax=Toxocara canis TaxID=6265 RepID=A0A0B2W4P6_TOXCA|nr:Intron-binding protein aquarius [Toxocara canis]
MSKKNETGKGGTVVTVRAIQNDKLTEIALQYWATYTSSHRPFDASLIDRLYNDELLANFFDQRRVVMLEFSQYLEQYLWPNFDASHASVQHVMSIVVMINEKFRERIPAWRCIVTNPHHFAGFFHRVLQLAVSSDNELSTLEQSALIAFLVNCFNSVEVDIVRSQITKIVSLPIWINLLPAQREDLFEANPKLRKYWNRMEAKMSEKSEEERETFKFERTFLWNLLNKFKNTLDSLEDEDKDVEMEAVHYLERCLELFIDLEALLTTSRHLRLIGVRNYSLLIFYYRLQMTDRHYAHVIKLQKAAFKYFRDSMPNFFLLNVSAVDTRKALIKQFDSMNEDDLYKFAEYLHLVEERGSVVTQIPYSKKYLIEMITLHCERRLNQLQQLNDQPLYPTEKVIWDENLVPYDQYNGDGVLALNKLNLQFLTFHDYLLRNFNLFQMESTCKRRFFNALLHASNVITHCTLSSLISSEVGALFCQLLSMLKFYSRFEIDDVTGEPLTDGQMTDRHYAHVIKLQKAAFKYFRFVQHEIRQDIEDTVFRMKPWAHETDPNETVWGGWARMALPINSFQMVEVAKPLIGEKSPAVVKADITIALPKRSDLRFEWEGLRKHDVCFLLTCRPTAAFGTKYDVQKPFKEQIRIVHVRGCELEGILDATGNVIEEYAAYEKKPLLEGDSRTYRVWLDQNQYRLDTDEYGDRAVDEVYYSFNLIIRRDPKTNNFKAVLATIRQLLNTECVVPDWLHDLILGYGEPNAAHYKTMINAVPSIDFCDTFLSYKHLVASFPNQKVVTACSDDEKLVPPFRLTFNELEPQHGVDVSARDSSIVVEPYVIPSRGPYPHVEPRKNTIHFTPAQIEAIKSGMQPGLTIVVGPPGTGKTDVAVQIISNIYHNWPEQRTLIVTHSNQALNQLFEKIIALDVDERHLLRMGHGEEALETEKDFSRYGRVNYVLKTRLELLKEVEKLQRSLEISGDVAYTCETAGHFFLYQVFARWEKFESDVARSAHNAYPSPESVAEYFPFSKFFEDVPPPLFKGVSFDEDWEIAEGCWRYIRSIFTQLEEFRSFELLRSGRDRTDYLLVKEAKIIAMTCTHAALRRKELVELGFRYDNILMEEAAQILEVETFIPLLLQNPQDGRSRLKRWIMIGDHHQLPPVVQNVAFQKYSNMEQSLFSRFVRLGVPHIQLDRQGRSRSEIAALYNWRYRNLGNLPHVEALECFQTVNAGFVFNYQLIDVPDFNGIGETTPSPYFYQNLGEAEYAVALFIYMRILGYPAEKISIITTYNGQASLLRDVVERRCAENPLIGITVSNLGEAEYAVALFIYMRILGYPAEKISIITTYNGQASLLRDVVERRCAENPLIGIPHKISTVDKYQGQQNDYIILSLVRTRNIGHIRDVRRLVVALSRARLGLYVLGRADLYRNCFEITPAFQKLCLHPTKLLIVPNETFPTSRKISTVDKYQGQQNDYIILSLVRTRNIGHIRDVRRLVVALSRARLGLYVLGRADLYRNCFEITPAFQKLCLHPTKLLIVPNETFPTSRKLGMPPPMQPIEIQDTTHMSTFVHQFYMSNMQQMKASYKEHMKDYFDARQAAIDAHLAAEAAARAAEAAKTEEQKGVPEPTEMEAEETEITFESMDFERQDPEKLGQ